MTKTIAETQPARAARPPGYSLDEAARISGALPMLQGELTCPQCGEPIDPVIGADTEGKLWLVRCHACGRGVVLRRPQE